MEWRDLVMMVEGIQENPEQHRTENFTLICWIITSVALMAKLKKRLWKTCRK